MTRTFLPAMLFFAALAAAVAGGAAQSREAISRPDPNAVLASIAKAPAKARARANPYEGQPEAIGAGEKLYGQHCAECHGDDARGNHGRAANLRSPLVQSATPGQLALLLRNGNLTHGMPSWSGIPEQRRWQIVAYLKNLGAASDASSKTSGRRDDE